MSQRELIFNSINGSFVDGYGIRSTIFLKGCPLKCKWCCNPEGQAYKNQLRYIEADCNGCSNCLPVCPENALSFSNGKAILNWEKCNHCGKCTKVCWQDALTMAAKEESAQEIFERIRLEKPFFDRSGGGLTIGGGEASSFPEFCLELIALCHESGISVAVDSCGYTIHENSFEVLKAADLILYDIKGIDPQQHLENTGVSNELILENFKKLSKLGKSLIVRLPIIPGYNDSIAEENTKVALLKSTPHVERVDVLPFHTYGKGKYKELGMTYPLPDHMQPLPNYAVERLAEKLKAAGLNVQIGG